MNQSFTYIIRSQSKESGNASDCYIRLTGIPTQFSRFQVEVVNFFTNTAVALPSFELQSDDFPFVGGFDTHKKRLQTMAILSYNTAHAVSMTYTVGGFNGLYHFKTVNQTMGDLAGTGDWVLVLKVTPVE